MSSLDGRRVRDKFTENELDKKAARHVHLTDKQTDRQIDTDTDVYEARDTWAEKKR